MRACYAGAWRVLPAVVTALCASRAAAEPQPDRRFEAQTLFEEAKALAEANRWDEVCPKLEESEQLDPHMVTVYRLADCYEHIGRTASAWGLFLQAASQARSAHEDGRAKVAEARASALEPKLSRLIVTVSPTPGLQVTRGDTPIAQPLWGLKTPVDPGPLTIRATAPGKKPFVTTVSVPGDAAIVSVAVPALEDEEPLHYWPADAYPGADRSPPKQEALQPVVGYPPARRPSSLKTVGGITFAAGLGTMGTAVVLMASNGVSESCPFTKCGLPLVLLFSGAVATTVGGVLWLSANSEPSTTVSFGPGSVTFRREF